MKRITFVAVSPHYWGRGDSEKSAVKQLRLAGGDPKRAFIFRIEENSSVKDFPYVDDMGNLTYSKGATVCKKFVVNSGSLRP